MSASITTIATPLTTPLARAIAVETGTTAQRADRFDRARLRLTRRGRAVFGTLATLMVVGVLAIVAMFSGAQAVATAASGQAEFGYVVVQPGDSLWQLASELDSNTDPRNLIAEIVRLNQLESSAIEAGEPIAVPLRYVDSPGVIIGSELGIGS